MDKQSRCLSHRTEGVNGKQAALRVGGELSGARNMQMRTIFVVYEA